ncbi:MAG TPA: DUF429 domain-containing protein [Actinomycetota bacterium]
MNQVSVGVDGWKKRWVAVALRDGRFDTIKVFERFEEVLATFSKAAAIGVDIPIGMPEEGSREADVAAREFLRGSARSVFTVPPRSVLEAPDHASASQLHRALCGKGLSKQSYALKRGIFEVDELVRADDVVIEVHPEASFRELNDGPVPYSKKSWAGALARKDLLVKAGISVPDDIGTAGEVPMDDVLDAAVAAWSARRYATGKAESLPSNPPPDARGRLVAIWY